MKIIFVFVLVKVLGMLFWLNVDGSEVIVVRVLRNLEVDFILIDVIMLFCFGCWSVRREGKRGK